MRGLALAFLIASGLFSLDGSQPTTVFAQESTSSKPQKGAIKQREVFDINTATKAELETLKGIGPVHADAIIKGRPYARKDELVRKKIISREVYDEIKRKIFARRVAKPQ